jgi:hypothetical protein
MVLPRRANALVEPLNGFAGITGFPTNHRAHVQRHQLPLDVCTLTEQLVGFERVGVRAHQAVMVTRAGLNACQHHQGPTQRLAVFGAAAQRNRALGQLEPLLHIEPAHGLLGGHQQRLRLRRHRSAHPRRCRIDSRTAHPGDGLARRVRAQLIIERARTCNCSAAPRPVRSGHAGERLPGRSRPARRRGGWRYFLRRAKLRAGWRRAL